MEKRTIKRIVKRRGTEGKDINRTGEYRRSERRWISVGKRISSGDEVHRLEWRVYKLERRIWSEREDLGWGKGLGRKDIQMVDRRI